MKFSKLFFTIILSLSLILLANSCQTVKQVADTLANLKKIQFKVENVSNLSLMGIGLSSKGSIKDFSLTDGLKLTKAFSSNSFPTEFTVNVSALNPNSGVSGTQKIAATLAGLDWRLYIDDVPTISGDIASPITIPGSGQAVNIPLKMSLDLYKFFSSKGYDGILNLALALGGMQANPARIKLDAQPSISTPFGPITYPNRITIINKQYSN